MDPDGGDGGGFDGCECVWSHELATRRIINMIRQTQDYCTENECLTDGQGQGGNGGATGGGTDMGMLFIGFWFLLAVVLFFMRPRRTTPPGKGRDDDAGPSFQEPPPPTAS